MGMTILALIISVLLGLIAAIHISWGIGFWFPIRDEAELVRTVVGVKGAERMPGPIPCGLVAAGLIVVIMTIWGGAGTLRSVILLGAALVFLARGFASFTKRWRRLAPQEPFATLDRTRYGPLCIGLGVGLAILGT